MSRFARLSLQQTDGVLGDIMKCYCSTTRTVPGAERLCGKRLKEVFGAQKTAIRRKTDSAKISTIVDELPDVLGVPTVNTRFTYFDTESNEKSGGSH